MTRVTADFWVSAYLARLMGEGIPAHLVHKGDATAGAIAVKVAFMNGKASLFTRHYSSSGKRVWEPLIEDGAEGEVDETIRRQRGYDRDLWVVEVEDPRGRHMLDRVGLEE